MPFEQLCCPARLGRRGAAPGDAPPWRGSGDRKGVLKALARARDWRGRAGACPAPGRGGPPASAARCGADRPGRPRSGARGRPSAGGSAGRPPLGDFAGRDRSALDAELARTQSRLLVRFRRARAGLASHSPAFAGEASHSPAPAPRGRPVAPSKLCRPKTPTYISRVGTEKPSAQADLPRFSGGQAAAVGSPRVRSAPGGAGAPRQGRCAAGRAPQRPARKGVPARRQGPQRKQSTPSLAWARCSRGAAGQDREPKQSGRGWTREQVPVWRAGQRFPRAWLLPKLPPPPPPPGKIDASASRRSRFRLSSRRGCWGPPHLPTAGRSWF